MTGAGYRVRLENGFWRMYLCIEIDHQRYSMLVAQSDSIRGLQQIVKNS